MTGPTVGCIVHYVSYGTPGGEYTSQCRAAVVTATGVGNSFEVRNGAGEVVVTMDDDDPLVASLCVLNPTGMFFREKVPYQHPDNGPHGRPRGGTWHWPERAPE